MNTTMTLSSISKTTRREASIDGETSNLVPHWVFEVDGERFHATPHYSGLRLIVGKKGDDGRVYLIGKGSSDLGSLEWHADGSYTRHALPHTPASRWLAEVNYTDDNQLWAMLEA